MEQRDRSEVLADEKRRKHELDHQRDLDEHAAPSDSDPEDVEQEVSGCRGTAPLVRF